MRVFGVGVVAEEVSEQMSNDTETGHPSKDQIGTVRGGSHSGLWVLLGRMDNHPWISMASADRVSHEVMAEMRLQVIGTVPGSCAERVELRNDQLRIEAMLGRPICGETGAPVMSWCTFEPGHPGRHMHLGPLDDAGAGDDPGEPDLLERFLDGAGPYLPGLAPDEMVETALDVLAEVRERANVTGIPVMDVARGYGPGQCSTWFREGDDGPPQQCTYRENHIGAHSFDPQCQAMSNDHVSRQCIFKFGHFGRHSFESGPRCAVRDGAGEFFFQRCWYGDGHPGPHSWADIDNPDHELVDADHTRRAADAPEPGPVPQFCGFGSGQGACVRDRGHSGPHVAQPSGMDRLPRITADCSLDTRPSIQDTWWLISQVYYLRAQLRSVHALRFATDHQQRCLLWSPTASTTQCTYVAGHAGTHSWETEHVA